MFDDVLNKYIDLIYSAAIQTYNEHDAADYTIKIFKKIYRNFLKSKTRINDSSKIFNEIKKHCNVYKIDIDETISITEKAPLHY